MDRRVLALRLERACVPIRDDTLSRPAGSFPDEHRSRLCELLQPSRDVDRVSAHHELTPGCCISAGDDFACIDANAERDLGTFMALADRGCEHRKRLLYSKGGAHRSLRVVFVGLGYPEDGQDGIAHELFADTSEALHLRVHECEQLALERSHILGVEPLAQRRRPGEVGEKYGDYPPLFLLRARVGPLRSALQRSSARRAESGGRGLRDPHVGQVSNIYAPQAWQNRPPSGASAPRGTHESATLRV